MNVKDGGNGQNLRTYDDTGDHMFYTTLLVFERKVQGTIRVEPKLSASQRKYVDSRMRTAQKRRLERGEEEEGTSTTTNDDVPFIGYEKFNEIEFDDIDIARWSSIRYGRYLKDEDEPMFVRSILNEGGLNSFFFGIAPDEIDDDSY